MLSDKQKSYIAHSTHSFNIASGAVSSGKTYIQILRFYDYIYNEVNDGALLQITGKTSETIYDNVIRDLLKLDAYDDIVYHRQPLRLYVKSKNVEIACVGADNEQSWGRIQGKTVEGWLGDEVTQYPKTFFQMAQSRVRKGQGLKFLTCNPASPFHYVKKDYIDNKNIDVKTWNFTFEDNPVLSDAYKNELRNSFTGVFYDRLIEGKWVNANSNVVYTAFDNARIIPSKEIDEVEASEYVCSWDFGVADPTAVIYYKLVKVPKSVSDIGYLIYIHDEYTAKNMDFSLILDETGRRQVKDKDYVHYVDASGRSRGKDLTSYVGDMRKRDYSVRYSTYYAGKPGDMIANANRILKYVYISEDCSDVIEMFYNWSYPSHRDGSKQEGRAPYHDVFSHFGTSFYFFAINRFPPKSKEFKFKRM